MATALYRNPQSEVTIRERRLTTLEFAEFSALARDLEQLCAEGMIEGFRDEHNVVRYRPVERA